MCCISARVCTLKSRCEAPFSSLMCFCTCLHHQLPVQTTFFFPHLLHYGTCLHSQIPMRNPFVFPKMWQQVCETVLSLVVLSKCVCICASLLLWLIRLITLQCPVSFVPCCAVLCHAVLCHAVLCHAVLRHAVLCCAALLLLMMMLLSSFLSHHQRSKRFVLMCESSHVYTVCHIVMQHRACLDPRQALRFLTQLSCTATHHPARLMCLYIKHMLCTCV